MLFRRLRWGRGSWLHDDGESAIDNGISIGRRIAISVPSVFHPIKVSDALVSDRDVDGLGERDRIVRSELDLHLIVIHHADALGSVQSIAQRRQSE